MDAWLAALFQLTSVLVFLLLWVIPVCVALLVLRRLASPALKRYDLLLHKLLEDEMARQKLTRGVMMDGRRTGRPAIKLSGTTFATPDNPAARGTVDSPAGGATRSVAQNDFSGLKAAIGEGRNRAGR